MKCGDVVLHIGAEVGELELDFSVAGCGVATDQHTAVAFLAVDMAIATQCLCIKHRGCHRGCFDVDDFGVAPDRRQLSDGGFSLQGVVEAKRQQRRHIHHFFVIARDAVCRQGGQDHFCAHAIAAFGVHLDHRARLCHALDFELGDAVAVPHLIRA